MGFGIVGWGLELKGVALMGRALTAGCPFLMSTSTLMDVLKWTTPSLYRFITDYVPANNYCSSTLFFNVFAILFINRFQHLH